MKGWAKKMIWFFGINLFYGMADYGHFLIYGVPRELGDAGFILLCIIIGPLFFLGDDETVKGKQEKLK